MEIDAGIINWDKLYQKALVAIELIKEEQLCNKTKMRMSQAFTFKVNKNNTVCCYKIFNPINKNGVIYCSGFQFGTYDATGKPIMISQKVGF